MIELEKYKSTFFTNFFSDWSFQQINKKLENYENLMRNDIKEIVDLKNLQKFQNPFSQRNKTDFRTLQIEFINMKFRKKTGKTDMVNFDEKGKRLALKFRKTILFILNKLEKVGLTLDEVKSS